MQLFKRILGALLFIIIFLIGVTLFEKYGPKNMGPYKEYKPLHDKELRTVIESIYQNKVILKVRVKNNPEYLRIDMRDSATALYGARPDIGNYPNDFFKKGDSIIKKAHNDTIIISRDSTAFYFLLPKSS